MTRLDRVHPDSRPVDWRTETSTSACIVSVLAGLDTRSVRLAKKVFDLPLVTVSDGQHSNLVKALRGESPFGIDLPTPPPEAEFSRMPAGLAPVRG